MDLLELSKACRQGCKGILKTVRRGAIYTSCSVRTCFEKADRPEKLQSALPRKLTGFVRSSGTPVRLFPKGPRRFQHFGCDYDRARSDHSQAACILFWLACVISHVPPLSLCWFRGSLWLRMQTCFLQRSTYEMYSRKANASRPLSAPNLATYSYTSLSLETLSMLQSALT